MIVAMITVALETQAQQAPKSVARPIAKQVITINLGFRDGQFYLGEIPCQITDESVEAVDQENLLKLAEPILRPEALAAVRALPLEAGFIRVVDLERAGLPFAFDIGQMTLSFFPTPDQRPGGHVTLGQSVETVLDEQLEQKASVAGFVNLNGNIQYTEPTSGGGRSAVFSQSLGTVAAIRVMGLVIENEATLESSGKVTRQGTRAVFDDPANAVRYTVGDVTPATVGMQTGSGLLGFAIEKSYEKLQPQKNIRPTGLRSFRLERPSEVDIVVNGQIVRRLQMPPGEHDISELPLKAGENVLTLEITDDTGNHTTLKFSVFFDNKLLAPGVDEWGAAAGYRSTPSLGGVLYSQQEPAFTGYYQRGLTEELTSTLHTQISTRTTVGGVMLVTPTSFGQFSFEADGSLNAAGMIGAAIALTYTPETLMKSLDIPGLAQFAVEYRSADFTPLFAANGSVGESFSLNGFYSISLPDDYTVGLSASLSAAKPSGGISISKTVQPDLSWLLTAAYDASTNSAALPASGPWNFMWRLSLKLDNDNGLSFTRDGGKSIAAVNSQGQAGDGHYAVKADMETMPGTVTGEAAEAQADIGVTYSDPRFEVSASRSRQFFAESRDVISDVSTVAASGAVAFADGHVAVGRPITDGFAIVTAHESLDGANLSVGTDGNHARPTSDSLGPLLISDLPSYSITELPITVDNAPAGYDLGSGLFKLRPAYRSGYVLQAGSEYSVTATGTLQVDGKPIVLLSGLAKEQSDAKPRRVVVFTNASGRFCAEGLKPGRWRIEMIGDSPKCFQLIVPENTSGIFDAGVLSSGCTG